MPKEKVFKEIQINYGNLSGASVPACLSLLQNEEKLQPNDKIVTAVAGLGGEFGGFAYVVPEDLPVKIRKQELSGKVLLITGAVGMEEIALKAAEKGSNITCNTIKQLAIDDLKQEIETKFGIVADAFYADLRNIDEIENLRNFIEAKYGKLSILINTHAITGSLGKASAVSVDEFINVLNANYYSIKNLCDKLSDIITDSVLITGSVGEDAQFAGSSSYVAAKRALRAYSVSLASKVYPKNLRCIYYLPGIVDSGMMSKLEESQVKASMNSVRQKALIPVKDIAERMLRSSYRLKVSNVRISYESHLMVVKDGYFNF
jgi:short-subunit dehydrogenase